MSVNFCGIPVSPTNKTDRHDIIEILLKVALNTMTLTLTVVGNITPSHFKIAFCIYS
jgi:hypothetical protein